MSSGSKSKYISNNIEASCGEHYRYKGLGSESLLGVQSHSSCNYNYMPTLMRKCIWKYFSLIAMMIMPK